jgi:hypothetical protein
MPASDRRTLATLPRRVDGDQRTGQRRFAAPDMPRSKPVGTTAPRAASHLPSPPLPSPRQSHDRARRTRSNAGRRLGVR